MNILFIAYRKKDYSGRTRELFKIFSEIGNVIEATQDTIIHRESGGIFQYICFLFKLFRYIDSYEDIDYLVLDDRKAFLPGLFLTMTHKYKKVIIDCWELYFSNEVNTLTGKIGCYVEKLMIKKADIIIAANNERAEIMKDKFKLASKPLVFNNINTLEFSFENDEQYDLKYNYIFEDGLPVIISTAGCNLSQGVDVLVKNADKIKTPCKLVLIGNQYKKDKKVIQNIIFKNNLSNVILLQSVGQSELKYLLQRSKIGIVTYGKTGTNNMYCASGKLYEYAHENLPVVTTSNPPLVNICQNYKIGYVDDNFYYGIDYVLSRYNYYLENVQKFAKENTTEKNNEFMKNQLLSILET